VVDDEAYVWYDCCSVSSAGASVTSSVITTCVTSTPSLQTLSSSAYLPTLSLGSSALAVVSSSNGTYTSSSHDAVVEQARQVWDLLYPNKPQYGSCLCHWLEYFIAFE